MKKQLEPYKRTEKKDELTTMFIHIYGRIFLSELIRDKAYTLSGIIEGKDQKEKNRERKREREIITYQ